MWSSIMHVPETRHLRSTTLISPFLPSVKIFPENTPKNESLSIYFDDSQILWKTYRIEYQSSRVIFWKWDNVSKFSPRLHILWEKWKNEKRDLNPQAPVAQKTADEVVFRHFQGEGVDFFKLTPHQIFDAHLLVDTDLGPSRFHFQWFLYQDHVLSQMVL